MFDTLNVNVPPFFIGFIRITTLPFAPVMPFCVGSQQTRTIAPVTDRPGDGLTVVC